MGMFDRVRCRYPLPHHQDAEFQTKDLARIARDEPWLGGFLDEYEISEDGRLTRHVHEREWREDPKSLFGGYLTSIRDWWLEVPGAHGDVCIYTNEGKHGKPGYRWIEFRIRFTDGRVEEVEEVPERGAAEPRRETAGAIEDDEDGST